MLASCTMRSSPLLPSLAALRAFVAVGRTGSFRRAGEDLLITQSAISHHVRVLETSLGVRLFDRHARGIALTAAGARYLERVADAFAEIERATADVLAAADRGRVVVSLLPSFAANWLLPRLATFRAAHPAIDLVLDPTLERVDLASGTIDLAIRYGEGSWPGCTAERLMDEQLAPVVSPAYAAKAAISCASELLGHIWLHTRSGVDWNDWARAAGIDPGAARHLTLTDYNIVLEAAIDGQGVAMGRLRQIASKLESGALVIAAGSTIAPGSSAHWLLCSERSPLSPAAETFASWLRGEAARAGDAVVSGA